MFFFFTETDARGIKTFPCQENFPLSRVGPEQEMNGEEGGRGCSLSPASGKQQKSTQAEKTWEKFHISASRLLPLLNTEFHPSQRPEDVPGSLAAAGWMPITCARTFKRRTEE